MVRIASHRESKHALPEMSKGLGNREKLSGLLEDQIRTFYDFWPVSLSVIVPFSEHFGKLSAST